MEGGRRFSDSLPALDPITDSSWDRLSSDERAELLKRRHAQVIDVLRLNVDATHLVVKRLEDEIAPLLEANTAATARTEATVDSCAKNLEVLVKRSEPALDLWDDVKGTGSLIGRVGTFIKDSAWFAFPIAVAIGAGKAVIDWAKAGFPGWWQ